LRTIVVALTPRAIERAIEKRNHESMCKTNAEKSKELLKNYMESKKLKKNYSTKVYFLIQKVTLNKMLKKVSYCAFINFHLIDKKCIFFHLNI